MHDYYKNSPEVAKEIEDYEKNIPERKASIPVPKIKQEEKPQILQPKPEEKTVFLPFSEITEVVEDSPSFLAGFSLIYKKKLNENKFIGRNYCE